MNACETTVTGFDEEYLHIQGNHRILWAEAKAAFRLAHAVTAHASQSRTYQRVRVCLGARPGHVHRMYTARHLNVAVSRCTSAESLCVE